MTSSVDPDQMASSEAIWSGSTLFAKVGVVLISRMRFKLIHSASPDNPVHLPVLSNSWLLVNIFCSIY